MSSPAFASTADLGEKTVSFDEIGKGVYAYTAEGDPNSGIVVGDDSVLVFDAQATPTMAERVVAKVREVTDKPVSHVVLSHYHAVRVLGASGVAVTKNVAGHEAYMAPEQARGESISVRADLFAVAVVLWELLAGRRLFQRDNGAATLNALLDHEVVPITALRDDLGSAWDGFFERGLAREGGQVARVLERGRRLLRGLRLAAQSHLEQRVRRGLADARVGIRPHQRDDDLGVGELPHRRAADAGVGVGLGEADQQVVVLGGREAAHSGRLHARHSRGQVTAKQASCKSRCHSCDGVSFPVEIGDGTRWYTRNDDEPSVITGLEIRAKPARRPGPKRRFGSETSPPQSLNFKIGQNPHGHLQSDSKAG